MFLVKRAIGFGKADAQLSLLRLMHREPNPEGLNSEQLWHAGVLLMRDIERII
jgi:hypothetical protein